MALKTAQPTISCFLVL